MLSHSIAINPGDGISNLFIIWASEVFNSVEPVDSKGGQGQGRGKEGGGEAERWGDMLGGYAGRRYAGGAAWRGVENYSDSRQV